MMASHRQENTHTKSENQRVERAFKEVKKNEPKIVGETRRKKGKKAAEKQKIAIALSKARRKNVKLPKGSGPFTLKDVGKGYKVV
jgi:predicted TIM-barrel fold metal-dependent hydrolase